MNLNPYKKAQVAGLLLLLVLPVTSIVLGLTGALAFGLAAVNPQLLSAILAPFSEVLVVASSLQGIVSMPLLLSFPFGFLLLAAGLVTERVYAKN